LTWVCRNAVLIKVAHHHRAGILRLMLRAVIDANVVVAALRSRRGASFELLGLLRAKKWKLVLSNTVVTEYEEVLKRGAGTAFLKGADVDKLLDALCVLAERRQLSENWIPLLHDPDDEALAHLAAEAKVDCLVTFNIRHLAPLRKTGILVMTAGEFLVKVRNQP
jgi:putative PIN family toxin of toxin-antitoxin system